MGNMQYDLSGNTNKYKDSKLLYAALSQFDNDWPSIVHSHYFTELFYITSGEGAFQIEGSKVSVKTHDLIIINPNVLHAEKSQFDYPLEYVVLGIEGLAFDFLHESINNYKITNCNAKSDRFTTLLNAILKESQLKKEGYIDICNALMIIFLTEFLRFSHFKISDTSGKKVLPEVEKIKSYIDSNISKNITLDSLASIAHLNKFYLSHEFIDAYGISPIKYLAERRIHVSKDLLENTDYSISQITEATGFSSQSYFSQRFKNHSGLTPTKFREKTKKIE